MNPDRTLHQHRTGLTQAITRQALKQLAPPDPNADPHNPQPGPYTINPTAQVTYDRIADQLVARLTAETLAEQLPPTHVQHQWHGDHTFTLTKTVPVPRHRTWWDMLKDTYRTRWWMRAHVRRHPVNYVDQPITVTDRQTRTCRHDVQVEVSAVWTYPQAPPILSGVHLGPAVLKTWHDGGVMYDVDTDAERP